MERRRTTGGSLRLLRGGPSFLEACSIRLLDLGATGVISPPLPLSSQNSWTQAGFKPVHRSGVDAEVARLIAGLAETTW